MAALPNLKPRTVTLNGFSNVCDDRLACRLSWRPGRYEAGADGDQHATSICAAAPSQFAALAILDGPQEPLDGDDGGMARRRDYLYDRLGAMGLPARRTPGSYYVLADIIRSKLASRDFAARLLAEESTRVTPGTRSAPAPKG